MKRFYFQTTVVLLVSLLLLACDDKNKNYPTDYVGFEHSMQSHFYSKSDKEETIEVKVIAVDKKKEDREVKLSINRSAIPGIGVVCKLNNDRLIIKAGKKEAKATITLFPGKAIKGEIIQIVCTPLWEGGQTSKMSIELIPK
ncbi:hypothetical protein [Bacteroides salyersiae]|uniref:hypothetical protein n=1 Tax=Bacteroides salyersiae TaxID=291644 RepID=UPI0018985E90|nr:hypothetical protein [Bacteroides salyersiae]